MTPKKELLHTVMSVNQLSLAEGIQFFPDSPVIERGSVEDRFQQWSIGNNVMSGLVVIGYIQPTPAIEQFVNSEIISRIRYSLIYPDVAAARHPVMQQIDDAFDTVVDYDKDRAGLQTRGTRLTFAGYSDWQKPVWHPDSHPFIRWALSNGQDSTWAVDGQVNRSDCHRGLLDRMIREGALIQQPILPAGYVVRFLLGDIHSRPPGRGNRAPSASRGPSSLTTLCGWRT